MSRVIITEGALKGLERTRIFLDTKNPMAAKRAAQVIEHHLRLLEDEPEIGRPLDELPVLRELIIPFGETGYISLYRYEPTENVVYVLAFRHQKKVGY